MATEMYSYDEVLRDGIAVRVRAARPDDGARLRGAFRNLEQESIFTRFFGYKSEVSEAELARLTGADFDTSVALLVTIGADADEVVIGGGSYVVDRSGAAGRSAEIAFIVEEDFQGRGIASLVLRHMITIARTRGIDRFEADVLSYNLPMLSVFQRCGLPMLTQHQNDVLHVTLLLTMTRR